MSTQFVNSKDEWVDDDNCQYIRIDRRKRANDVVIELRNLIAAQKNWQVSSTSKYPVTGMPNIRTLVNRYNALLVKLTTKKSDTEIFTMGLFRITQSDMGSAGEDDPEVGAEMGVYKVGSTPGRTMRDLMLPAKVALLSVCDGYFVSHPTKTYI